MSARPFEGKPSISGRRFFSFLSRRVFCLLRTMSTKTLSRRNFLKHTSTTTLGLAALGAA
ncbi:MAG: hypothetical protein ACI8QF_003287, partial [Limisphaerales bacterium]